MDIQGIHLSWIVVQDFEAALHFYTNVLGLTLRSKAEEFGWAELSGPSGSILAIAKADPRENLSAGSNAVVTISVKNIEEARKHCIKNGVALQGEIIEIPGHVRIQSFSDLDGNRMQLVETL